MLTGLTAKIEGQHIFVVSPSSGSFGIFMKDIEKALREYVLVWVSVVSNE